MSDAAFTTPLQNHTLDTLLDELVSGRPIALNGDGQIFQIASADARSVFSWYRDHRDKWAKSVAKDDIEAIVSQLDRPAAKPAPAATRAGASGSESCCLSRSVPTVLEGFTASARQMKPRPNSPSPSRGH